MGSVRPETALLGAMPLALSLAVVMRLHPTAATAGEFDPGTWDRLHAAPAAARHELPEIRAAEPDGDDVGDVAPEAEAEPVVADDEDTMADRMGDGSDEPDEESDNDDDLGMFSGYYGSSGDDFWYGMWRRQLTRSYANGGYGSSGMSGGASGSGSTSASRPAYMFVGPSDGTAGSGSPFVSGGPVPSVVSPARAAVAPSATLAAPDTTAPPRPSSLANARVRVTVDTVRLCALEIASLEGPPRPATVLHFRLPGAEATGCSVRVRAVRQDTVLRIDWADPAGTWAERAVVSLGAFDRAPSATVVVVRRATPDGAATSWVANLSRAPARFVSTAGRITVAPGQVARVEAAALALP